VNSFIADTMGDYVAAGVMDQGNTVNFGRKSGVLTGSKPEKTETLETGKTVDLRLVGSDDGYALTFGESTVSAGYDYPLTGIDPEHIYVGFYAVRNCKVTFSDICLRLT